MIADLLRNDFGKVCEFGSVPTPELARLERFAQVQPLVSTVEGRLRKDVTHLAALNCRSRRKEALKYLRYGIYD